MPLFVSLLESANDVRCPLIKGGVRPIGILKANSVIDDPFHLKTVGNFLQIDGLLFQGPPQFFNLNVIQITAPAIQQDFDFAIIKVATEPEPSLICVHDLWLAVFGNKRLQCLNTKANIQRFCVFDVRSYGSE